MIPNFSRQQVAPLPLYLTQMNHSFKSIKRVLYVILGTLQWMYADNLLACVISTTKEHMQTFLMNHGACLDYKQPEAELSTVIVRKVRSQKDRFYMIKIRPA